METKVENTMADYMTTDRGLLSVMFIDKESADRAFQALIDRGYTKDEINLIMSDETRKRHFPEKVIDLKEGTKAAAGMGTGGAIGTVVGVTVGIIAAIGTSIAIPGLGIVIAGPLAAGLAGAGAGGITGGIIGGLIGAGMTEERARIYEKGIKKGHIVLSVHPRTAEDAEEIEKSWQNFKGTEIHR